MLYLLFLLIVCLMLFGGTSQVFIIIIIILIIRIRIVKHPFDYTYPHILWFQYRYAYTNMMKLHLEKIEKVEQVSKRQIITTKKKYENIKRWKISQVSIICQNQGGRFLGLSWRGASAFHLSDQMVQWRHRPNGEKLIKQNLKTEESLMIHYFSSPALMAAQEPPARETTRTQMFSMTTRCLGCQGFSLNKWKWKFYFKTRLRQLRVRNDSCEIHPAFQVMT